MTFLFLFKQENSWVIYLMSAKLNDGGLIQWIKCLKYIFFKNTNCKLKIMIGIQYITKDPSAILIFASWG